MENRKKESHVRIGMQNHMRRLAEKKHMCEKRREETHVSVSREKNTREQRTT
jgi:hypothetical protein